MTRRPLIVEVLAGPLYWTILAASVWVLVRGHHEPGGGFIGGLVAVAATALYAVDRGTAAAARVMPFRSPVTLAAAGVCVAGLSGLPAVALGLPYLEHLTLTLPLGFATISVPTVLVFDIGVYLAVWGAISGYALELMIDEAAEPTPSRKPRS